MEEVHSAQLLTCGGHLGYRAWEKKNRASENLVSFTQRMWYLPITNKLKRFYLSERTTVAVTIFLIHLMLKLGNIFGIHT